MEIEKRNWFSVKNFLAANKAWLSKGHLRALLFNRNKNGLRESGAVLTVGRKVLIDADAFMRWVESCNNNGE